MRITRETMLKVANDAVARKTRASGQLLGAYLCGSLLGDDYLLGGTADIDLVFLHTEPVEIEREIVRLTDDVHLDIAHHYHRSYRDTRALRIHPWLGPTLYFCKVLYDPQHFLDFTQASVRGQFHHAEHVWQRAHDQSEAARSIWFNLSEASQEPASEKMLKYLYILELSANSIAALAGRPLTERRFLMGFSELAGEMGQQGLYPGFLGMLGGPNLPPGALAEWLPAWQEACLAIHPEKVPARLHPDRLSYYASGYQAILGSSHPLDVLWPLLNTWTLAVSRLPEGSGHCRKWEAALETLELTGPAFSERVIALDAYLDRIDETLEDWARTNGVWAG